MKSSDRRRRGPGSCWSRLSTDGQHLWTTRHRVGDAIISPGTVHSIHDDGLEWGPWIVSCSRCGQRKETTP